MKKKLKPILVLALPYILTVLLPIMSVLSLGSMVMTSYREKIITDKQESIEVAFNRFLQRIDNIQTLSHMIAQNDEIIEYAYASMRGRSYPVEKYIALRDLLSSFMINNDVTAIYLYDSVNHRVITTDAALGNAAKFFEYKYSLEGYTSQECIERWNAMSWGCRFNPSVNVVLNGTAMEVLEYGVSVPLDYVSKAQPHLILVMNTKEIFGDIYDILEAEGEFYIYDSREQMIFSHGSRFGDAAANPEVSELRSISVDGETLYYMNSRSDDKLWRLEIYMPDLMNGGEADTMPSSVWLLISVPVIASILFCIYFTFRNHRELQDVLNLFRGQANEPDEKNEVGYKAIRAYANKIMDDNDRFRERITQYDFRHKYEVLDKMIRNTYANREAMEKALENTDLCIRNEKCLVLCIRYEDASYRTFVAEGIVLRDLVKEFLMKVIEGRAEVFDISARETICVLAVEDINMEVSIRNLLSILNVEIIYSYGAKMQIGVGSAADSIYQIHTSYTQAKEVIRYNEMSENQVIFFSELEKLEDVYYFPRETGEKLYNNVVAGRVEDAKEIVRSLYAENFEHSLLSVKAIERLKSRIRDSIISIAGKYDICLDDEMQLLHDEHNIRHYFEIVCDVVDALAGEIKKRRMLLSNDTVRKIMSYIHENYCDSALSLKQISLQLGLHETYISKLFKEEYGENLSVVIEKLRIEKSFELLKNTDQKISEIAGLVGYTSDLSFRRAFKKMTGVTPGEYRDTI